MDLRYSILLFLCKGILWSTDILSGKIQIRLYLLNSSWTPFLPERPLQSGLHSLGKADFLKNFLIPVWSCCFSQRGGQARKAISDRQGRMRPRFFPWTFDLVPDMPHTCLPCRCGLPEMDWSAAMWWRAARTPAEKTAAVSRKGVKAILEPCRKHPNSL